MDFDNSSPEEYLQQDFGYFTDDVLALDGDAWSLDNQKKLKNPKSIPLNKTEKLQNYGTGTLSHVNSGIIHTFYMKTPKKLKKVPLKFSTYIPNIGVTSIVFNPALFDSNIFSPKVFRNIIFTKNSPETDERFKEMCENNDVTVSPKELHFAPASYWPEGSFSFGDLVSGLFQRKNNANCRFYHKLYNALQISKNVPDLAFAVGVEWANENIIKVRSNEFARLLGIKSIEGSLFHQQGNFPTHGFVELSKKELQDDFPEIAGLFDFSHEKAFIHKNGSFTRSSNEQDIVNCNWSKVSASLL